MMKKQYFAISIILFAVLVLFGHSATLYRTGFEEGTGSPAFPDASGGDVNINNGYNGWGGGQSGVHLITTTDAHKGNQSLKVTDFGSSQPNLTIQTQTNKNIYLTFWTKCAANGEFTYIQSKQSSGGSMSEIKISTNANIEVSADNTWVSAGNFEVGTGWFAIQIEWIWDNSLSNYNQQTIYAANIGDTTWTTVGTKATRFDQPNLATIMITKENGSDDAFIDDLTISDTEIVPNPDAVTVYETGFEAGTGSPAFPDASGGDVDISGYGGWTNGQSGIHVITTEDAQRSKQSFKATGWGTSQPINIFDAQSGEDIYLRVWAKNPDPGAGKVGYLEMHASNNATLGAVRFSITNDIEVIVSGSTWQPAGSFDVTSEWFAMMIQYQWNGSLHKYDRQTIYAANKYDKDWTNLGSTTTRFQQPDIGRLLYTKVTGTEPCYIDDIVISDAPIETGNPPFGAFMVIR